MNREQWKDAARFAGVENDYQVFFERPSGRPILRGIGWLDNSNDTLWKPDMTWNDFGKLWRLLMRWLYKNAHLHIPEMEKFAEALTDGTEQELMQAGCELAAAIGATMEDKA